MALGISLTHVATHTALDGWRATGFRSGVLVISPPGAPELTVRLPADGRVMPLGDAMASCPTLAGLVSRHRLNTANFVAVPSVPLPLRAEARWLYEVTIAARAGDCGREAKLFAAEVLRARESCPAGFELATRLPGDGAACFVALRDQSLSSAMTDEFARLAGTRFLAVPVSAFSGARSTRRTLGIGLNPRTLTGVIGTAAILTEAAA